MGSTVARLVRGDKAVGEETGGVQAQPSADVGGRACGRMGMTSRLALPGARAPAGARPPSLLSRHGHGAGGRWQGGLGAAASGGSGGAWGAPRLALATAVACLVAVLLAVAGPAAAAGEGLAPGTVLDATNAAAAKGLLPPEVLAHYEHGEYLNKIAAWPKGLPTWDADFVAATKANAGRFTVDKRGTIVARDTGKPPETIYGLPFPSIDPSDPQAGVKVIWNAYYSFWSLGNSHDFSTLAWVGRRGLERAATLESYFLFHEGQPPRRRPPKNPLGLAVQSLATVTAPADLEGTAALTWRYRDGDKRDSAWTYVPALRRVRAVSPANRSDGFLGSDMSQDDGAFFDGKPEDFTWRLVGEREALVLADPYSLSGDVQREALPNGGVRELWKNDIHVVGYQAPQWKGLPWAPVAPVLARRRLWVIEATPRDPYYLFARLQLGIDKEAYRGVFTRKFDSRGALLISLQFLRYASHPIETPVGTQVLSSGAMGYIVAENVKKRRATVAALAPTKGEPLHERRIPLDPGLFSVERLNRTGK